MKSTKPNPKKAALRTYRHRPTTADYIPAPRKGWHYEAGRLVRNAAAVVALVALAGCATTSGMNVKDINAQLPPGCVGHYSGSLTAGLGVQGSIAFDVTCGQPVATPAPVPAAQP